MRKLILPSLGIGVASDGVALAQRSGWFRPIGRQLGGAPLDGALRDRVDQMQEKLAAMLADQKMMLCLTSVTLASELVRTFVVTPPEDTMHPRDCRAAAQMVFQEIYCEDASDWCIEAEWSAMHPFIACAAPRPLIAMLERVAAAHRLKLLTITPQLARAWNRARHQLGRSDWFGVMQGDFIEIVVMRHQQPVAVRSMKVPAVSLADPDWLRDMLCREALRWGESAPQRLVFAGEFPINWVQDNAASHGPRFVPAGRPAPVAPTPCQLAGRLALSGIVG